MRIFSNTAITLDGKIAVRDAAPERLGTKEDWRRMSKLRLQADAILIGGNTFRDWPLPMLPVTEDILDFEKKILNVILTHDLNIEIPENFLRHPQTEVLFMAPQQKIPQNFSATVWMEKNITPEKIVAELQKRNIKNLLLEAGGTVLAQFLNAGLLHEMYVTICPKLIGDPQSPSFMPVDVRLNGYLREMKLIACERDGDEIFLKYEVKENRSRFHF